MIVSGVLSCHWQKKRIPQVLMIKVVNFIFCLPCFLCVRVFFDSPMVKVETVTFCRIIQHHFILQVLSQICFQAILLMCMYTGADIGVYVCVCAHVCVVFVVDFSLSE